MADMVMRGSTIGVMVILLAAMGSVVGQTVVNSVDPNEKAGERPYEMVWAGRTEKEAPTIAFSSLDGWRMEVSGGAEASLSLSRAQNLWDRPVAKLRYRSDGSTTPRIAVYPPSPVAIPDEADSAMMWAYGNRWDWMNTPDTPPVRVILHLRDAAGNEYGVQIDQIRWEYWFLSRKGRPSGMRDPVRLESIEFLGGTQKEWRELFFDSIRFYKEGKEPLTFAPRPKRNLTLAPGQSTGANTGPGVLPFPTREETILPMQFTPGFKSGVERTADGYLFRYSGKDCEIAYTFDPSKGLPGLAASVGGAPVGRLMVDSEVRKADGTDGGWKLRSASMNGGAVVAGYEDGTEISLRIMQKSLVVDVTNRTGKAADLRFGRIAGADRAETIWPPFLTFGGTHPSILLSRAGKRWIYTSIMQDWYRSNGSEPYGQESVSGDGAAINGGVRYLARTDGRLNPMYERFFVTVSPTFEEVLPTIANPVGLHAAEAVDHLWQESWGPSDYEQQMQRSRTIRAYGVKKLIQCNHEISWRDGGESFTMRVHAAPAKGGDDACARYVAHQRGLGWISGLYTNYTDFAPVNEYWDPDFVQRSSDGEWRGGWPRCWALKPLRAVEMDALLAPQVQKRYGGNSSYTDVHTAVAPWWYNDFDARVPGAGTFTQTFYAYGELLRNDSKVYGGPIFSEGTYHYIYAGLADGNYGHTYDSRMLANEPLLPSFDLYQIHTKECDIGISWTANFCDAIPNWQSPAKIDNAIDRFLLHIMAYGHIGWLVEEEHGIERTCRSYYMLQQVQARYGLKAPDRIAYWDGKKLVSTSEALVTGIPRSRRQLYVEYPGGLKLWLNDHPTEDWTVRASGREIVLPPAGWLATQGTDLFSYSAIVGGRKADYLRSGEYVYQDGRGRWLSTNEAAADGGLAIYPSANNSLEVIRISGSGEFAIRRPFSVRGTAASCEVYDAQGARLADAKMTDSGSETWVEPVKDGVRYILHFSGGRPWSTSTSLREAIPGATLKLSAEGKAVQWRSDDLTISGESATVPSDAKPGSILRATATSGGETRTVTVRVCEPVWWRWQAIDMDAGAILRLQPSWGASDLSGDLTVSTGEGWTIDKTAVAIDPKRPPKQIDLKLASSSPAGATGELAISLLGVTERFALSRVARESAVYDLRNLRFAWGVGPRGKAEIPNPGDTGGVCYLNPSMAVGGVTKAGVYMHPAYKGMVAYTWAEFHGVELPKKPCALTVSVGLMDGGDPSDGVVYRIEVSDESGERRVKGEQPGVQREWRPMTVDLAPLAGRRVTIKLIADPGSNDNTAADWACWGEPTIRLTEPGVATRITR